MAVRAAKASAGRVRAEILLVEVYSTSADAIADHQSRYSAFRLRFTTEIGLAGSDRPIEVDSFSEPLQLAWTAFAGRAASAGHQLPM